MKNTNFKNILFIIIPSLMLILLACEDSIPTDYIPENIVEAILIVDEPIEKVIVMRTQPVNKTFNYDSSLIKDAIVRIIEADTNYLLSFRYGDNPGYYYSDTNYKIRPNTKYKLEIELSDGTVMKAETITPQRFNWIKKSDKYLQYPLDTIKLPARDTIAWTTVPFCFYYAIAIKCLDTLEYGRYLYPEINELNRRVYSPFADDHRYKDVSSWAAVSNNKSSIVWNVFKWFGKNEVNIFAGDYNFIRWYIQSMSMSQYNELLGSIEGGKGAFGSVSAIRDTIVLLKNQP